MPTYAIELEYDGAPYVGWQRQKTGISIQQLVEEAAAHLAHALRPTTIVAGRTDSGVHAEAMVAQLALDRDITPDKLRDALNYHLKPHPVVVLRAAIAPEGWNARFSAIKRAYRYRLSDRRARPALELGRVWHVEHRLDAAAMHAAAQPLLGRHDFTSFRASSCQAKSPIRTLERLDVARFGDIVEITIEARSFLHHQVRNFAGTLKLVGERSWPVEKPAEILAATDRAAAGPTAPPQGLTLTAITYPTSPFDDRW